jgi:class 3 adenylate cyclase/tetratricopeptide (TPR) repeat protein
MVRLRTANAPTGRCCSRVTLSRARCQTRRPVLSVGWRLSASVTATFVFTDLVDSTATAARLGPEAAEELRQAHFRLLRSAVTASGGTEVKNLGDGLMVMYSSPSRALSGAVGMQQAIEHHNRSGPEPLGVRIGVSAGEAVEEDDDYFGDPVVEAARLCASAAGGQILAADLVRLMVGRHATQTFVAVGPLALKGIPEPVDAVEVLWEPATMSGSVPLPGRLVGAAADALFGFFGRGPELAGLEEARKRAHSAQRCQAVFVAGEAGMGKTALAAQFARRAHGEGAVVLFGHADEDLGVAYQPWIEALTGLVRFGDPSFISGLRGAQRAALARLVPEVGFDAERVADPETERMLLLEGATEFLAAASQQSAVVVMLDDLHWADAASLQLLRHVIGSTKPMNVTIVCTYRDTDLSRGDPLTKLLADMHREATVTRMALGGLDDVEVVELMAAAAGHDLDAEGVGLAHAVRRETDGNPFFTAEILRHLGETGGIVLGDDGRWTTTGDLDELSLPSSVRDVVGRRVERLGDEALRVLCLAAVIGREFDISFLAQLADADEDPLLDLMDAAVSAAVLVESGTANRYRFAHALIQHSLYDEVSPARRQRTHQRIAETLETEATIESAATLAELAHHWVAATRPADLDKALDYVRRAGDAARDALAPDDAIRWYQQALDLVEQSTTPDELERAGLLAALGTVQWRAGHQEYRDSLLQAAALALQLGDSDILVHAALGFALGSVDQSGDDEARPVIEAALDRIGNDATPNRARLLAARAGTHDGALQWQTRRELSLQAIDVARATGDEATFIEVADATLLVVSTPDRRDQVIDDLERMVAMADRIGDPVPRARLRFHMMWARYQQADIAGTDTVLTEIEGLAEMVGLPWERWQLALLVTGRLLLGGHSDQAETANNEALELGLAANAPDAFGAFGGILYVIRQHQGQLDEIADLLIDSARNNPSIAVLRAAVPAMLCELGRIDEAHERLTAEAAGDFDFPYDQTWLASMSNLADTAATTGDQKVAQTLLERLAPFAHHIVSPSAALVRGAIARPLARAATLLGDYDRAEEWFAIGHDIHARLDAPFWTARGQLDHADLCLARRADGDIERARELATTAAATAAEYGCAGLTKRAAMMVADMAGR